MNDEASTRQIRVLAFVAVLAPAAALPGLVAKAGGALGWLSPILAIPPVAAWFFLFRSFGPEGLAAALRTRWGRLGRLVSGLYYLWVMALAALTAGQCVNRLVHTDYAALAPWRLSLALTVVVWYLTARGRGAFLRAVEIFYLVLLAALILFFVLGAWGVRAGQLIPRSGAEAVGAFSGLLPTLGTFSVGGLAAFFPRSRSAGKEGTCASVWWCLAVAGVCALVIGTLGSTLAGRVKLPFFLALQGIGLPGGLQRLEGLGTAVWALSDLTLMGAAALAGRHIAGDRRWGAWPILLAGAAGGGTLTERSLELFMGAFLWSELIFGAGIPLLLRLTPKKFFPKREGE